MKQLIALGNGCLCPAAQGNILEVYPTDPALRKHIQATTQIPGLSAFPAPLLIVLLFPNTYFMCLFHQPPVLNVVCSDWQRCRCALPLHGAARAAPPPGPGGCAASLPCWGIPAGAFPPRPCGGSALPSLISAQSFPSLPRAEIFPFLPAFTDSPLSPCSDRARTAAPAWHPLHPTATRLGYFPSLGLLSIFFKAHPSILSHLPPKQTSHI